jgi:small subunit ribosomal protein S5
MTDMAKSTGQQHPAARTGGPGQRRGGRDNNRGPDRRGRGPKRGKPGRDRDMDDMKETVITINRVSKVVKGGRRFSFSAIVAVGDGKGKVGVSLGKANEIADAIRKASEGARANQFSVPILNDTIPFKVEGRFAASRVVLRPAASGTGVIASGGVRAILEAVGLKNILTKQLGSKNPHNVWKATVEGLKQLRSVQDIAAKRGISVPEVFGLATPAEKTVKATATESIVDQEAVPAEEVVEADNNE